MTSQTGYTKAGADALVASAVAAKAQTLGQTGAPVTVAQSSTSEGQLCSYGLPTTAAAGDIFELVVTGTVTNTSGSSTNIGIRAKISGTNIIQVASIAVASATNARHFSARFRLAYTGTKILATLTGLNIGDGASTSSSQPVAISYQGESSQTVSLSSAQSVSVTASSSASASTINVTANSSSLVYLGKAS